MELPKSGRVRTVIIGFGGAALAVLAEKYMMPTLPDGPTISIWAWVVVILALMAISLFWDDVKIVRTILGASALTALIILVPNSRIWVSVVLGIAFLVWLGFPRIVQWLGMAVAPTAQPGQWIDRDSAIQMIQQFILDHGGEFETDQEIRQRLAAAIHAGTLRGYSRNLHTEVRERLSIWNVDEMLDLESKNPSWNLSVSFWSLGLDELMKQIEQSTSET